MKIQLQPKYNQHQEWLNLAEKEGFTFEVAELAIPLPKEEKRQKIVDWYRDCGMVTAVHGAFIDNNPVSGEPDIAKASQRLIEGSCRLAVDLGAKYVVFHSSGFPFLRGAYLDGWVEKTAQYYCKLVKKYDLTICIENSTDQDPEPIYRLMKACENPKLRVCLDVGHVNYSREPLQTWFEMLGDYIDYIHLSDNFGAFDDHLPIGIGTVPWNLVNELCRGIERELTVTLETDTLEQTLSSIDYLKEHNLMIWDPDRIRKAGEQGVKLDLTAEEKQEVYQLRAEHRMKTLQNRNELLGKVFRRYLSHDIVMQVLNDPHGLSLGGKKVECTMLMSDLHAFTAATEHMEAQFMIQMLNHYYSEMHDVTGRHDGTIIDMVGDGLLVAFGLFNSEENHADRAIACAIEMISRMDSVNEWNRAHDFPVVHMGIGVDTGTVVAGNLGSRRHIKYGLVGSHVNMCSRIESYTNREQVLISESTREMADAELVIRQEEQVFPKGSSKLIMLYDVVGIGAPYNVNYRPPEDQYTVLKKPAEVEFFVANDKHIEPTTFVGRLTELCPGGGIMQTDASLQRYDSLRLNIVDALFCRVGERTERGWELCFTSVPRGFNTWYDEQIGRS